MINYCEYCGKKLTFKYVFEKYNTLDGQALYSKKWYCPNRNWYNQFLHLAFFVKVEFGQEKQLYTQNYIDRTKGEQ